MIDVLSRVAKKYPEITLTPGTDFSWSYETSVITYPTEVEQNNVFVASLCHELGHAFCTHKHFKNDIELIKLEREAWNEGSKIAKDVFGIDIPDQHIERCLNTYRDWLYERAVCPTCKQCGMQSGALEYRCVFCHTIWTVNASRLCRVIKKRTKKT